MNKKILYFIFTIFFTVVIFFINYNFFLSKKENLKNNVAENLYIETQKISSPIKNNKINLNNKIKILEENEKKDLINYYKKKSIYKFLYNPKNFKNLYFENNLKKILNNQIFKNKIKNLKIILNKELEDRRGNMKNKTINLYGLTKENEKEYISIFIHELGHFIDLYFFEKSIFIDISNKFYEISWNKTTIKKKGQNIGDFVSGYAMTNKYEDFAETFNFYILHNKEFLEKLKKSEILKKKYDFFSNYLFKNKVFFATDFSNQKYQDYYWDTTKINYSKENFFKYLENFNNKKRVDK